MRRVAVSLTHEQALIDYETAVITPDEILGTLRDIGYDLYDPRKLRPFEDEEADLVREGVRLLGAVTASLAAIALILSVSGVWSLLVPASVVTLMVPVSYAVLRPAGRARAMLGSLAVLTPAVLLYAGREVGPIGDLAAGWLTGVLALVVVLGVAPHILRMAYQAARRGILNQHVLLEVGAFAGIAGGVIGLSGVFRDYPTASFFAVTVLVANYHIFSERLSLLVKTRSSQSVKKLLDLQPDTARVVRDGAERDVAIAQVVAGDLVRVRPGERIPVDGEVREGFSVVDVSLVTGEPVPAEVGPDGEVVGGSINGAGSLLITATRVGTESFLAQVVRHVEDARALKPGILHLVDRVLRVYTPTVLVVSALALVGWLAGSWALAGEPDVRRGVFAALGVLVMGYPCAVGIAAPLAIVRAAGEAADRGIIMRTGEAFQTFGQVRTVLLDKTGTLTEGRPDVRAIEALDDEGDLLQFAAAAESSSEHPLARAVVAFAENRGLTLPTAQEFTSVTGLGVTARIEGRDILVGRPQLLTDRGVDLAPLTESIGRLEQDGHTVIAVAADLDPVGVIALGDQLRTDAVEALAQLKADGLTPVQRRVLEDVAVDHSEVLLPIGLRVEYGLDSAADHRLLRLSDLRHGLTEAKIHVLCELRGDEVQVGLRQRRVLEDVAVDHSELLLPIGLRVENGFDGAADHRVLSFSDPRDGRDVLVDSGSLKAGNFIFGVSARRMFSAACRRASSWPGVNSMRSSSSPPSAGSSMFSSSATWAGYRAPPTEARRRMGVVWRPLIVRWHLTHLRRPRMCVSPPLVGVPVSPDLPAMGMPRRLGGVAPTASSGLSAK